LREPETVEKCKLMSRRQNKGDICNVRHYSNAHILYSRITGDQDVNKNTCRFCASVYSTAKKPNTK
jgi:hypothetical protein